MEIAPSTALEPTRITLVCPRENFLSSDIAGRVVQLVRPLRAPKIMLTQDIITRVRQDFSEGDAVAVVQLLSELQQQNPGVYSDRILRCIVYTAEGSFDWLASEVALARIDWRDVIVNAEYDKDRETHRRDFNLPFTQDVA